MLPRIDGIPNLIPTTNHKKIFLIGFLVLFLSYFVHCSQDLSKHVKSSQQIVSNTLNESNKNVLTSIYGPSSYENELSIKNDQIKKHASKPNFLNSTKATSLEIDRGISALSSGKLPKGKGNETINKDNLTSILHELPKGTPFDNGSGSGPDHIENDATIQHLKEFILGYVQDSLSNRSSEIFSGIRIESSSGSDPLGQTRQHLGNDTAHTKINTTTGLNDGLEQEFRNFVDDHVISINLPRAVETGRLFFFKGLKKFLWPVFIGIQIAKTFLLALFLPSILGSLGKMLGKGLSSVSGFNHQSETVNDLDFKDDTYNFDQDNSKYNDYAYQQQPEASTNHFATQMYDATALNNNALSRFGFGDQKLTYVNTGGGMYKDTNGLSSKNNFKIFQDIPASSLLLSNYDPFYSPLLSRLDSVFQQLGLGQGTEACREKLICLMYANPAKYAPYSNLVSAQLSRELNELRKPTSDNPDILRFFKYMRAAKDGQDGEKCEDSYSSCDSFKESENPAMLATYHDINKLVHARKFNSK